MVSEATVELLLLLLQATQIAAICKGMRRRLSFSFTLARPRENGDCRPRKIRQEMSSVLWAVIGGNHQEPF
jgi:hypothetical protein